MKKAVIMPFVLMFITALSILVINFVSDSQYVLKNNTYKDIIETNTAMQAIDSSINNTFKNYKKVPSDEILAVLNSIEIKEKKSNIEIKMNVARRKSLISINSMFEYDTHFVSWRLKPKIKNWIFDMLTIRYEISQPSYLFDLIIQTLNTDSEIGLRNIRYNQGKIYTKEHFNQILDYYYEITEDEKIFSVPFDKIFCFDKDCEEKLYCEKTTQEVRKLIFEDFGKDGFELDCLNLLPNDKIKLSSLNTIYESNDTFEKIDGEITFTTPSNTKVADFVYDFNKKGLVYFDIKL